MLLSGQRYSGNSQVADVSCDAVSLKGRLADGRQVTALLSWYSWLANASMAERRNWKL